MEFIDYGSNINSMLKDRSTFLRSAITKDTPPIMKYMLLNRAVIEGYIDCVKYLIDIGAEYKKACYGLTSAICNAAAYGRIEILQYMHALGANILICDDEYSTIYYAYSNGHFGIYLDKDVKTLRYLIKMLITDQYVHFATNILSELMDTGVNQYRRPLLKCVFEETINWLALRDDTYFANIPRDITQSILKYYSI